MIGIVDLHLGNLKSVANAVYELGFDYIISNKPEDFAQCSHLIMPGVGSYHAAIQAIESLNLRQSLQEYIDSGRPLLGICLGMQVFSDIGEEIQLNKGLGLIPGRVIQFSGELKIPVPHVGWNTVNFQKAHPVFNKIKNGVDFYFVHSYHFACDNKEDVLATTDYGYEFPAIVGRKNVIGVQFHPEKSQKNGLQLIENFCQWGGK